MQIQLTSEITEPYSTTSVTRKMVPITGRASSLLEIILYVRLRGLRYQKQNRMEEETEPQT